MVTFIQNPESVKRVVILGAKGFVASATHLRLKQQQIEVLPLSHADLDLTADDAGKQLSKILKAGDTLLFVSANAPVKDEKMLLDNIKMGNAVCESVKEVCLSHLVYISSDAVYADSFESLNELSCTAPNSLHGIMHLTREIMLKNSYQGTLCILRPTLIFGKGDPHNGYGPNRFIRLAEADKNIELFGNGEEQRDHVWIEDVANVITRVILGKGFGVLNIASGNVVSFREIAEKAVEVNKSKSQIITNPRNGPMPHNGLRSFDISALVSIFPDFHFQSLFKVIEKTVNENW